MEGLLPMVYKAIKRNRSRQKYECLSSGAAQSYMNISDVEHDPNYKMMRSTSSYSSESMSPTQKMKGHRRHQSYAFGMSTRNTIREDDVFGVGNKKAQLVRFRSHRFSMFSCVGGC